MDNTVEAVAIKKAFRRLVGFLALMMFCAVMDRVNVGFAALSMNKDLGLSSAAFGFGAGLFSLGYLLFEIPSNLILLKVGARRWLARIMVTWALLSMATSLASGPASFYALRFALGVAEAGFLPGVMVYLGYWFPGLHRARTNAVFLLAMPVGQSVSALLSGLILNLDGLLGIAGWQWLFVLEGLPSLVIGIATWFYLTDRPADAGWLLPDERAALETMVTREKAQFGKIDNNGLMQVFCNPTVLSLGLIYSAISIVLTGVPLWLPQIVRTLGLSYGTVGLVAALPPLAGAAVMVLWGRSSDRRKERIWHIFAAMGLCAFGWLLAACFVSYGYGGPVLLIGGMVLANGGVLAASAVFWTLPSQALSGRAAATGIALISAMGNVGSTIGPLLVGHLRDTTQGFALPFLFMVLVAIVSGALLPLISGGTHQAGFKPETP
jgi:MFS transporter, ACS family, tartrate transporter